jgi:hypothetical protein
MKLKPAGTLLALRPGGAGSDRRQRRCDRTQPAQCPPPPRGAAGRTAWLRSDTQLGNVFRAYSLALCRTPGRQGVRRVAARRDPPRRRGRRRGQRLYSAPVGPVSHADPRAQPMRSASRSVVCSLATFPDVLDCPQSVNALLQVSRPLALTDRTGMSVLTVAMEGNADSICSP